MSRNNGFETRMARYEIERHEKWREIMDSFPFIKFPADWEVQIISPFAGATARFRVKVPGCNEPVSVYADHYDQLGYYGSPYWEVYPHRGDVGRCDLSDTATLLEMIADREPSGEGAAL